MVDFEDKYMDVLQNIEFAIFQVYRQHPELTDYEVDRVLHTLMRAYQAEQQRRAFAKPALSPLAEQVYEGVRFMCDWRLGRESLISKEHGPGGPVLQPLMVSEVVACLKRIRKSVEKWNKQGGTRGYLQFINQFVK